MQFSKYIVIKMWQQMKKHILEYVSLKPVWKNPLIKTNLLGRFDQRSLHKFIIFIDFSNKDLLWRIKCPICKQRLQVNQCIVRNRLLDFINSYSCRNYFIHLYTVKTFKLRFCNYFFNKKLLNQKQDKNQVLWINILKVSILGS